MNTPNILIGCREADRKWTPSLMGYIHVWDGETFLYELKTNIKRLNKRDAITDAENLRKELLSTGEDICHDSEFIVRAVNSHEELLAVAKYVARPGTHIDSPRCLHCQAERAIAKAEGK